MAVIREDLNPTLISNTTMQKIFVDGVHKQYAITAVEGYFLHDNSLDEEVIDPDTLEPTGEIKLGYYAGTRTVATSYDFTANPREFYAVLESEVPADQIFNVPSGEHEVM